MNVRIGIAGLLVACVWLGPAQAWETQTLFRETVDLPPGAVFRADLSDANLELVGGGTSTVEIEGRVGSDDPQWARERFDESNLRVERGGGEIVVREDGVSGRRFGRNRGYSLTVRVSLPAGTPVVALTGDGDVTVSGMEGSLRIRSGDGDLRAENLSGSEVVLSTGDGDVSAEGLDAGTIELRTGDGDISGRDLTGRRIVVRTGDGDLALRGVSGELAASTRDGDVHVRFESLGAAELSTGDGDVRIELVSGSAAELDLEGADVRIDGDADFRGSLSEGRARGTLNGGGPELKASAGDGDVQLVVGRN